MDSCEALNCPSEHGPSALSLKDQMAIIVNDLDALHQDLISRNLEAEHKIEEQDKFNDLMKTVFKEAPIAYLVLDGDGQITDSNNLASEHFNINPRQLAVTSLPSLVHPNDVHKINNAIRYAKLHGDRSSHEVQCFRLAGQHFMARIDIAAPPADSDQSFRVLCSVTDITKGRILEETLKNSAIGLTGSIDKGYFREMTQFLLSLPAVDVAIISRWHRGDKKFRSLSFESKIWNPPRAFTYQIPAPNPGQPPIETIITPHQHGIETIADDLGCQTGVRLFLFEGERQLIGEIVLLTRQLQIEKVMVYDHILKIVSGRTAGEIQRLRNFEQINRNQAELEAAISERTKELKSKNAKLAAEVEKRKTIENRLRKAKIQAEQAALAKSHFLANMSHEIRTPMNGIVGLASLMGQRSMPRDMRQYLGAITTSANSMLQLINDILDFHRLESGHMVIDNQRIQLRDALEAILDSHLPKTKAKNLFVLLDYPYGVKEHIYFDPIRLRQLIDNILGNAIKFTDSGSIVVRVTFTDDEDRLLIEIKDTGIGIDADAREQIFDRFQQADSSTTKRYGGAGLGLAICREIAQLVGGKITCGSTPGNGSIFRLFLPVGLPKGHAEQALPTGSSIANATRRKILCAEAIVFYLDLTDGYVANALTDFISSLGMTVICRTPTRCLTPTELLITDRLGPYRQQNHEQILLTGVPFGPIYAGVTPILSHFDLENFLSKLGAAPEGGDSFGQLPASIIEDQPYTGLRVLVAEDNEVNRLVTVDMLMLLGAKVETAFDGEDALAMAMAQDYAIIFMDCLMPKMDGFAATAAIKDKRPDAPPIVALTANAMKGDRLKCLDAGFDEYMAKPVRLDDFIDISQKLKGRMAAATADEVMSSTSVVPERFPPLRS